MSKVVVIDREKLLDGIEDLDSIDHGGVPYIPLQNVKNVIWGFCELKDVIEFKAEVDGPLRHAIGSKGHLDCIIHLKTKDEIPVERNDKLKVFLVPEKEET